MVDGDFLVHDAYSQLSHGDIVQVPYLLGDNSDEGTCFAGLGLNTDHDIIDYLTALGLSTDVITKLLELYPTNSTELIPASHPSSFDSTIGRQWKRIATILTDLLMVAPRRLVIECLLAHTNVSIFNYHFNTIPGGVPDYYAVTHFMEVPFIFHNIEGTGYLNISVPFLGPNPFLGVPRSYFDMADSMASMWVSFFNQGDPNYHTGKMWSQIPRIYVVILTILLRSVALLAIVQHSQQDIDRLRCKCCYTYRNGHV